MRTVWLALLCLIGLATTVVVKIGMTPYARADVSQGVTSAKAEVSLETTPTDSVALSSENMTTGTNVQSDTLTKADKLQVTYINEAAPEVKSVRSIEIGLPTTEPKQPSEKMESIVNRHWHDPFRQTRCAGCCHDFPLNAKCPPRAQIGPAWSLRLHQSLDPLTRARSSRSGNGNQFTPVDLFQPRNTRCKNVASHVNDIASS
jgi:hypothetical protein